MEQVVDRDKKQRERRAKRAKMMKEDRNSKDTNKGHNTPLAFKEPKSLFEAGDVYDGVLVWG